MTSPLDSIKRWFEHRSSLSNPTGWLIKAIGGGPTKTGVTVNEQSALRLTAVYSCIRIISETVSSLPFVVYRRVPGGGKERVTQHHLYQILHDASNEEMAAMIFREVVQAHSLSWGNGYAQIVRDNGDRPRELWPLLPDRTTPKRDPATKELYYETRKDDGTVVRLSPRNVLHIPGLGYDGLIGYSPIYMAREAIGLGLAAEEFGSRFFGQGAHPGAVAEHPGKLTDQAHKNLQKSLADAYSGLGKSHKLMVLEEGMKFTQVGIPPDDAQFLETRKFQVSEIARLFRVPPHMIGDLEKATFSNIEQQSIDFVMHTIRPWLVRWEQICNMKLLTPEERAQGYFVEHIVDGLLRGDIKSRYEAFAVGRQNGWLSADDIRELENMNPLPDGKGKIYWQPLNVVEAGTDPFKAKDSGSSSGGDRKLGTVSEIRALRSATGRSRLAKAYQSIFQDAGLRIVRREKADILKAARKMLGSRSSEEFDQWLEEFYEDAPTWIQRAILPAVTSYAEAINGEVAGELGLEAKMTPELEQFVRDYADGFSSRHVYSSHGQLRQIVTDALQVGEDPLPAVEERLDEWEEKRPGKISMRETIQEAGAVALAAYKIAGILKLRWVKVGSETCPYCRAMDGKVVGIEEPFISEGDFKPEGAVDPMLIRGSLAHPPLHQGCDCQIVADY